MLKELFLRDSIGSIYEAQHNIMIKELKQCPQLERLTFSGGSHQCSFLDASTCATLEQTLQYLPKLQYINLEYNFYIEGSAVIHLARGLAHCAHLEELNLYWNYISDAGVKCLLECLFTNCKNIRKHNLKGNCLTNQSISSLVKFVESSESLQKLVLAKEERKRGIRGNTFSEIGWSKLVGAVKQRNSTQGMNQLELIEDWTLGRTW